MIGIELFRCPVGQPYVITQTYEEHLQYAKEHPEIKYNGGIDLYSDNRTVRSAFDGRVEMVSYQANGYGNYVRLIHVWGYSIYAHLERVDVACGEKVPAGTHLGVMGTTGFSTGVHLHFEMRDLTGVVLDPSEFFPVETCGQSHEGTVPGAPVNACSPLTVIVAPHGGNFRKDPMGEYITTLPAGTVGRVIDGPVYKYGLACYEVEFPVRGWMAESDGYGTQILAEYRN